MPTGYTHNVPEGISLRTFMLQCVKAMGVCISLRDEPSATPVPKSLEPDDYHVQSIANDEQRLEKLRNQPDEDLEQVVADAHLEAVASRLESLARIEKLRVSYQAMWEQVEEWEPPTPEHMNFKNFMLDQLEKTLDSDCNTTYYEKSPAIQTPAEYRKLHEGILVDTIKRSKVRMLESRKRNEDANAWLAAFWESLPPEK